MGSVLRNILFIFFCWSVGNNLSAASSCLANTEEAIVFADPNTAKIKVHFDHKTDDLIIFLSAATTSPAIVENSHLILGVKSSSAEAADLVYFRKKKHLLLHSSGTSPPVFIS